MATNSERVTELIFDEWSELDGERVERITKFYELLAIENKRQNLTKLIEPDDFVNKHLMDVKALWESDFLSYPAMDLGSGNGVPGLVHALIEDESEWILTESEGRKAEFLRRTISEIGISNAKVFSDRGEEYLKMGSVEAVVARGVGPIPRIFSWLGKCSTWNKAVLLKGPAWEDEWKKFTKKKSIAEKYAITGKHEYSVKPDDIYRIIVQINRNN